MVLVIDQIIIPENKYLDQEEEKKFNTSSASKTDSGVATLQRKGGMGLPAMS